MSWLCVCNLSYPARKTHAPYYIVVCGLSGFTTFFLISYKARFSEKKLLNIKHCSEIFFILRRIQRDAIINVLRSSCKNGQCSCQILIKLGSSWRVFEKCSNVKFHENLCSVSRVFLYGLMDRRRDKYDANSRFLWILRTRLKTEYGQNNYVQEIEEAKQYTFSKNSVLIRLSYKGI
jgi:hypothetical protein